MVDVIGSEMQLQEAFRANLIRMENIERTNAGRCLVNDDGSYFIAHLDRIVDGPLAYKAFRVYWLSWNGPTVELESKLKKDDGARLPLLEFQSRLRMYIHYNRSAMELLAADGCTNTPELEIEQPVRNPPPFWAGTHITYLDLAAWNWWDSLQQKQIQHEAAPVAAAAAAAASPITPPRLPPTPRAPRHKRVAASSDTDIDEQERSAPKAARRILPLETPAAAAASSSAAAAAVPITFSGILTSARNWLSLQNRDGAAAAAAAPALANDGSAPQLSELSASDMLADALDKPYSSDARCTFRVAMHVDDVAELDRRVKEYGAKCHTTNTCLSTTARNDLCNRLDLLVRWFKTLVGPSRHALSRDAFHVMHMMWEYARAVIAWDYTHDASSQSEESCRLTHALIIAFHHLDTECKRSQ